VGGKRFIPSSGHVRMMGAVQPFLSGAISKTVNLPSDATIDDVQEAYVAAWKQGLKAIAIYRDGSKRTQPLQSKRTEKKTEERAARKERIVYKPFRRRLPDERAAITHKFDIAGHEGYITVGMYEDGTPGEIFVVMAKQGSVVSGLMDAFATAISLALQYGVPLEVLVNKFTHTRFEPSGFTSNPEIRMAKSLTDYIFQWMSLKFLNGKDPAKGYVEDLSSEAQQAKDELNAADAGSKPGNGNGGGKPKSMFFLNQADSPPCPECGGIMVRNGACYRCLNCGSTSGCS
jgi:ribonucleoside-diphosphate reductase alpha chain